MQPNEIADTSQPWRENGPTSSAGPHRLAFGRAAQCSESVFSFR
jgi:hypothetical protein